MLWPFVKIVEVPFPGNHLSPATGTLGFGCPLPWHEISGEIAFSWGQRLNGLIGSESYLVLVRTLKSLAPFVYLDDFQRLLLYFTA